MLHVLVELDAIRRARKQPRQDRLAPLQRLRSQVVAVQLDQVERKEERRLAIAPMPYQLEQRDAVVGRNFMLPGRLRCSDGWLY
jgi:hypothetical protein